MTEVRRLRKARGLTQAALADLAKISQMTVSRMEKNPTERKGDISIGAACRVAKALDVDVCELFPDSTITYTNGGRLNQNGDKLIRKPAQIVMLCASCGMSVSARERDEESSDCCEANLRAA